MKHILLVDSDTLSRVGITSYIKQIVNKPVIHECKNLMQAKTLSLSDESVDIVIIKHSKLTEHVHQYIQRLTTRFSQSKLLLITQQDQINQFRSVLSNIEYSVIALNSTKIEIANALLCLLKTNTDDSRFAHSNAHQLNTNSAKALVKKIKADQNEAFKLTGRQSQVMNFIVQGYSNKQIAYELGISEGTIKLHVSSILRVLKVTNRTQAALVYSNAMAMNEPEPVNAVLLNPVPHKPQSSKFMN